MIAFITGFLSEVVNLFMDMAPYIMLGVLVAGALHVVLSKDFVARHVGGNNLSSVFKAALFGVPLPLCSCGVVPTAVYLKNSGASKPAVTSFLISTPQTGIDSITATYGMLGPVFALFKAIAALIMGMAGGIADFLLDRKKTAEKRNTPVHHVKVRMINNDYGGPLGKIREALRYAFMDLLDDITVNFIIGLIIAALISVIIPEDFFSGSFLSNPFVSMILMVIIGIPMYICSTSSIPIAVALIAKGVSPGAAYVFLVAGPATNAASLAIISKTLGRKTTVRYLLTIIIGSLLFGYLMDLLYTTLGMEPAGSSMIHNHAAEGPGIFSIAVSIVFLAALVFLTARKIRTRIKNKGAGKDGAAAREESMTRIDIEGMNCSHCTASVEKALTSIEGITSIRISLEDKCAYLDGDFDVKEAEDAVRNAGYSVAGSR